MGIALLEEELYAVTDEELELLKYLCLPCKIISQRMRVGEGTIRVKISRLCAKFGVENRQSLMAKALRAGWVSLEQLKLRKFDKNGVLIDA